MAEPRAGDRAEVRNAADPEQVKRAGRKERRREERLLALYRQQLASVQGRAFCWDLLERASVFRSVYDGHGGRQNWNIGRQDFGHELMALLVRADEVNYVLMETEARARNKRDAAETDAAHIAQATTEGDQE